MVMKDVVWEPNDEYIERANITRFMRKHGIKDYQELISRSTGDIVWFWDAVMEDLGIEWYQRYDRVMDDSRGIEWTKWFINGKLNIVHNCLDRHASSPEAADRTCLIWENESGESRRYTYRQLHSEVNRMANYLRSVGVRKGDRIGLYMPMTAEIVVAFLASLKVGAIVIPVFSGFGHQAVSSRLSIAEAKVLFTADGSTRRGKVIDIKSEADRAVADVPTIEKVVVLKHTGNGIPWNGARDVWWHDALEGQPEACETEVMDSEDYGIIIFSSGTTGRPKGTVHTHGGALAQTVKELAYYFDVKPGDVFFWLTDIGWMMGPWMIIGVLTLGGCIVVFEGAPNYPDPGRMWKLIQDNRINVLGISPTAIRLLMTYGEEWVEKYDLSSLRILGSTGEPWDAESWMWFFEKVGRGRLPIINISGGTEIIGCFLAPLPITSLKPCTLRGPGLGMDVDVFDEDGKPVRGEMGHLVAKKPAPSMTRGFWGEPERYIETYWSRWPGVWYHGDWALIDEDGFWFLHGRSDDTIKVAGRRTGPAEIEAALIEHPAVSEAAVIGVPDKIKGEDIVCFVVLAPGYEPSEGLRDELKAKVVDAMGKSLRPKDVLFVSALPKTRSAKIVRRAIKAKYLGKELGDTSSIENPEALEEIPKGGL